MGKDGLNPGSREETPSGGTRGEGPQRRAQAAAVGVNRLVQLAEKLPS